MSRSGSRPCPPWRASLVAGRRRLDAEVAARGLAPSREQAQRLIRAGQVRVDGQVAAKPGLPVAPEATVEVESGPRFVSRGGEKLAHGLDHFGLDPAGLVCLDLGASTGGFTDCLLQRGAARVIAVDVGRGQLAWPLRQDPRVEVREGVNARHLEAGAILPPPQAVTCDVSFISLALILPAAIRVAAPGAWMVTLIKPQFEAGREQVGKGGVVRDPDVHNAVIERIRRIGAGELGLEWLGVTPSPLRGPAGNREFLAAWRIPSPP